MFAIGLSGVFSLTGWCRLVQTGFHLPRPTQDTATSQKLTNTGLSPSLAALPSAFSFIFDRMSQSYNPTAAVTAMVWASPRSLATTNGITICFLFLRVLRCFSSPGLPPDKSGWYIFNIPGCPIRKSTDQFICADPRGLSQLITSFFASESQGIPHTPLVTFSYVFSFA